MRPQFAHALRVSARKSPVVPAKVRGRRRDAQRLVSPIFEPLEARQLLSTTYYVSPSGSDTGPGNSSAQPWKSITRVNNATLHAGDKVLFQGGQTFAGSIYVPSTEGGTASSPVVFSTYGSGRATINSGSAPGFDLAQAGGVDISNLNFVGNGMYNNTSEGISVHVDWAGKSVSSIQIENVDVSGYGREGIMFMADGSGASINDVTVQYVNTHDNLWAGLKAHNNTISGMHNYLIDHVNAWNIPGDKTTSEVTGNGIFLEGVSQGIITHCVSHDNGVNSAGSVGIWGAMGDHYTIEYCEAYNQDTRITIDGDGFDFDWDTSNSVMEYCYSHNNAGAGYLLAAGSHTNSGNVIRYNVSENDGRKNGRSGIQLWGNVSNASIYNNVVYMSATSSGNTAAFYNHDDGSGGLHCKNIVISNNIFYASGGAKVVNITSSVVANGHETFSGNCYYSDSGAFSIVWGTHTYSSLNDWRNATGNEESPGAASAAVASVATVATVATVASGNGSLSGMVYSDNNKDGVFDSGDARLASRKMYIDSNGNGKYDSGEKTATTNSSGVYTFTGLASGTYRVGRADLPSGFYISSPVGGIYTASVTAGQTTTVPDFGAAAGTAPKTNSTGTITGLVFSDSNKNGVYDPGEPILSNRKIYLDANSNGKLDAGEKTAVSNASGVYTFTGLASGTYRVSRGDVPGGFYISSPASGFYSVTLTGQVAGGLNIGAALGSNPTGSTGGSTGSDTVSSQTPGVPTGYQGNPMLINAGHGGTIGNADNLRALSAYKLQASSPVINQGVSQPGILASEIVDFFGDATPKGGKYDIGVDEVA